MPGPYINQAPVDDDMDADNDRPQGTDPQTMAILSRILSMLEAQTQPPGMGMGGGLPDLTGTGGLERGMGGGGLPGMPPPMPAPGMGGPPPGGMPDLTGTGGLERGMGGGGNPLMDLLGGGGPPGMGGPPMGPPPPRPPIDLTGTGGMERGMGGPQGGLLPFTQYMNQRRPPGM